MKKNFGMLLLGIWLALTGLHHLVNLSFSGLDAILAVVALIAGVLIILGR